MVLLQFMTLMGCQVLAGGARPPIDPSVGSTRSVRTPLNERVKTVTLPRRTFEVAASRPSFMGFRLARNGL